MDYVILSVMTLVVIEFGWRVVHYAVTGKGGVEDPLFLSKEERNWVPKKNHIPFWKIKTKKEN